MKYVLSIILLLICIMRIVGLATLPNGFYWDEMDNTYQAFSLLKTGKDMFGNPLPVLLHSFADYKSSLYIYATVPFVKVLGMTPLSARTPAATFGIAAILCMVYLAGKKWGLNWGLASGIIFGVSPWWFTYSRLSFEAVGMVALFLLGVACLQKAFHSTPKFFMLTGLFWSLAIWTYSTAKLFVPLFGLLVLVLYFRKIWQIQKQIVLATIILALIICTPVFMQSFFGKGNTRFNEISIFTDPTISSQVNYNLEAGELSSGVTKAIGLNPRIVDRLANNKFKFLLDKFITNYLQAFSTQFLFIKGDPNPRQSPGRDVVGQFLPLDFILLGLGLFWYCRQRTTGLLIIWLAIAPLPSIVTRDGGEHATRLLFMLPPSILLITAGLRQLAQFRKTLVMFCCLYVYFAFSFGYYYFANYRFESMIPFHWGFQNVAKTAQDNSSKYERVFIDLHHESDLMAFLVQTHFDPKLLQSQLPLSDTQILPGVTANKFGNIYILGPGDRSWTDYLKEERIPRHTLLILSADDDKTTLPISDTIYYPNGEKAFYQIRF